MADMSYPSVTGIARSRTDWGAIWAGTFVFLAIWSVFGALGLAIFASAANPSAAAPVSGMSTGMGIWVIVLTIIAMYVAGRETGRVAGVSNRHDGLIHGLIMFGLSVAGVIVLTSIAGSALSGGTGVNGSTHSSYIIGSVATMGWWGFVALFLGWLAAMGGASSGVAHKPLAVAPASPQQIRPAA